MKDKPFRRYYALSIAVTLLLSAYPLYMGGRVLWDMLCSGAVSSENYPKYIIPYTPVSLAVIVGVLLMPVAFRWLKKWALPAVSVLGIGVYLSSELLLEKLVIVSNDSLAYLGDWQMYMCYVPQYYTPEQILYGQYNPGFKLHFYAIAIVLVLVFLNCFYGFGRMVRSGDRTRLVPLVLQSSAAVLFLGLCILACFTAFFRTGTIEQGAVPATLMILFFVVFGVTAGVYVGSLTCGKRRWLSVWLPTVVAVTTTTLMYVGEAILLSGKLYRFGTGFFFEELGSLVLAPVDLLVVAAAGLLTALLCLVVSRRPATVSETV